MKKTVKTLLLAAAAAGIIGGASSCKKSDLEEVWDEYKEWRTANDEWLREATISGRYTRIAPKWNKNINVLIRWENDTTKTSGNYVPLYTSSVTIKYKGWLMDGTAFDSSYSYTDSVRTMQCKDFVPGLIAAMEVMHVGDKVEMILPYTAAYGSSSYGDVPPYSCLRFEIELRDIPKYELRP